MKPPFAQEGEDAAKTLENFLYHDEGISLAKSQHRDNQPPFVANNEPKEQKQPPNFHQVASNISQQFIDGLLLGDPETHECSVEFSWNTNDITMICRSKPVVRQNGTSKDVVIPAAASLANCGDPAKPLRGEQSSSHNEAETVFLASLDPEMVRKYDIRSVLLAKLGTYCYPGQVFVITRLEDLEILEVRGSLYWTHEEEGIFQVRTSKSIKQNHCSIFRSNREVASLPKRKHGGPFEFMDPPFVPQPANSYVSVTNPAGLLQTITDSDTKPPISPQGSPLLSPPRSPHDGKLSPPLTSSISDDGHPIDPVRESRNMGPPAPVYGSTPLSKGSTSGWTMVHNQPVFLGEHSLPAERVLCGSFTPGQDTATLTTTTTTTTTAPTDLATPKKDTEEDTLETTENSSEQQPPQSDSQVPYRQPPFLPAATSAIIDASSSLSKKTKQIHPGSLWPFCPPSSSKVKPCLGRQNEGLPPVPAKYLEELQKDEGDACNNNGKEQLSSTIEYDKRYGVNVLSSPDTSMGNILNQTQAKRSPMNQTSTINQQLAYAFPDHLYPFLAKYESEQETDYLSTDDEESQDILLSSYVNEKAAGQEKSQSSSSSSRQPPFFCTFEKFFEQQNQNEQESYQKNSIMSEMDSPHDMLWVDFVDRL